MVQTRYVASPQPQPQPVVVSSAPSSTLCYEGCRWSGDGECDDGRPGANTRLCAYGSDCSDCGPGIVASGGVYVAPESAGVGVSVY